MNSGTRPLLVGICDSNEIAVAGLRTALAEHGIDVYAAAATRTAALTLAARSRGRVVLVDIALDTDAAREVITAVVEAGGVPVAMGVSGEPNVLFGALRWGAEGYLTKDLPIRAWAEALRGAQRGEAPISRAMTRALVDEFRNVSRGTPGADLLPSDRRLTRREWQVLELVAEGKTNRTVAADLSISEETVRTHVSKILAKLETPNRSAAAARYHRLRLAR
jgi:DNA-binding NarL/FixJ family response regulator